MKEDELWRELKEVLVNYQCLVVLVSYDRRFDRALIEQLEFPMKSKLLVVFHQIDLSFISNKSGWEMFKWITFQNQG